MSCVYTYTHSFGDPLEICFASVLSEDQASVSEDPLACSTWEAMLGYPKAPPATKRDSSPNKIGQRVQFVQAAPLVSGMASSSSQGIAVPLLATTGQGNTGTVPRGITTIATNQGNDAMVVQPTSPQGELADALVDIRENLEESLRQMQDDYEGTQSRETKSKVKAMFDHLRYRGILVRKQSKACQVGLQVFSKSIRDLGDDI